MHIAIAPRGILQIDHARLAYRNFKGEATQYNRGGERNFSVIFDPNELTLTTLDDKEFEGQDVIDYLLDEGWNLKIKPPRDEDEDPFIHLPVKVKFNDRGPVCYLKATGKDPVRLEEDTIAMLDKIRIMDVDLDIRPYDWVIQEGTKNEKRGRTAYMQSIHVVQMPPQDRFAARYADINDDEEYPY